MDDSRPDSSFEREVELGPGASSPGWGMTREAQSRRAHERIAAQIERRTSVPSFLEAVMNETMAFHEPDRLFVLLFSGAVLTLRSSRIRGQPGALTTPDNLLQAAIRYVIRHKRAVRKNKLLEGSQLDPRALYERVGSLACAPVVTAQVDYGVVYADNLGADAPRFESLDLEFYRELGTQIAAGLAARSGR